MGGLNGGWRDLRGAQWATSGCLSLVAMTVAVNAQSANSEPDVKLPEIVVTSPSPVAKPAVVQTGKPKPKSVAASDTPAAPKPKAKAKSSPVEEPPTASPDPAEVSPASGTEDLTPPAGTLIVADDAFAPVTVTTDREIVTKQGQTITDALATKPGINASTFAPGASRPIVRGLDNYRVRVQENGIGSHDASALSEDHAVPIDPYAADRIEVIRGPATLRYGSQAIGGVVAVENERIPTFVPPGGRSATISGGISSVDDGRDGAFKATAGVDGIVVHADGFKRQAEDYNTPRGTQENSFADSEGGSAGISHVGTDGFLGVAVARVTGLYGIPGEVARIELEQDKVLAKGEWRVKSSGIEVARFWFGASDYAHNEVTGGEIGSRFTNREQEFRGEVQHQEFSAALGAVNGALGVQWGHRRMEGQSFEGSSLLEPAETSSVAAFLFEELTVTRQLRLQAAGRIEHTTVEGTGLTDFSDPENLQRFAGERDFTPFGLSTGMLYELPLGVVARLTGQYVERAPDAAELFSQGLHEATETFEIGNPNLGKEKTATIEIGLKKAAGAFRFDASAYHTRYDGFISKRLTGVGCGDTIETCGKEDDLDQLLFDQRDARFYGAEVIAQYDVAPIRNGVWGVEGHYDFVNARFGDGEYVPRIPPHRLGGGIYYRDAQWFARAGVLHAFEQDNISNIETPTDGYTLISAEVSYTTRIAAPGMVQPEFTVGIKGENLADDEVRNHSSFKKDDVLLPGANVRIFGTLKLN